MVISYKNDAPIEEVESLIETLKNYCSNVQVVKGEEISLICLVGETKHIDENMINVYPWINSIARVSTPYKLVSREFKHEDTIINVKGVAIGGEKLTIIAGPCAVESREQILSSCSSLKLAGFDCLRGGAFKMRTSPYSFQGLGYEALKYLKEASEEYLVPSVCEIVSVNDIEEYVSKCDIIQVGARNMQNFDLLKALGKVNKPILLKRGMAASIEELLMAAEYIVSNGNPNVILCERGIKTFEKSTRNTLDLSAIPVLKKLTHLPVIVDPSHATGKKEYVLPMSLASIAAGADGLLLEVHNNPLTAKSDASQALTIDDYIVLREKLALVAKAVGKKL